MRISLLLLAAALSLPLSVSAANGPEGGAPETQGEVTYRVYCASCHGIEGHGDGPLAAEMRVRPPDLTRIARRNKGTFPADEVAAAIDGRTEMRGHGTSSMPVWGLSFQEASKVADQEPDVRARLRQLVAYLRSIQAEE